MLNRQTPIDPIFIHINRHTYTKHRPIKCPKPTRLARLIEQQAAWVDSFRVSSFHNEHHSLSRRKMSAPFRQVGPKAKANAAMTQSTFFWLPLARTNYIFHRAICRAAMPKGVYTFFQEITSLPLKGSRKRHDYQVETVQVFQLHPRSFPFLAEVTLIVTYNYVVDASLILPDVYVALSTLQSSFRYSRTYGYNFAVAENTRVENKSNIWPRA